MVLISLDNVGSWNLRAENLDRWYLGQETYLRIINPEENGKTEMAAPSNVLYCGALRSLQKYVTKQTLIAILFILPACPPDEKYHLILVCVLVFREQHHSNAKSIFKGHSKLFITFLMAVLNVVFIFS